MKEDIQDSEIRIIGSDTTTPEKPTLPPNGWRWILAVIVVLAIAIFLYTKDYDDDEEEVTPTEIMVSDIVEGNDKEESTAFENETILPLLDSLSKTGDTTTFVVDTIINNVPLTIYFPTHMTPALAVGYDILNDTANIYLMFQAADVRGDTKKIAGDFVLNGERLSRRKTRSGFCSIIGNEVTIGTDTTDRHMQNTISRKGDFFRQYALVDSGKIVPNTIQLESKRRGLCQLNGHLFVVESQSELTYTHFSEILVALGVENSVYLIGTTSKTWCRSDKNIILKQGDWQNRNYEMANFIVWRR